MKHVVVVVGAAIVLACVGACACACATDGASTTTASRAPDANARATDETLEIVRRSMVQRVVREAPGAMRSGVARLVTMVPLDKARLERLAPAVSTALSVERLENVVALRLERALTDDERAALAAAAGDVAVGTVISAAVVDPANSELEAFISEPRSLPDARKAKVKALVDVTWSPLVVDRLTRAPVAAAGRIVAAALSDADVARRRGELMHIADSQRPGDPDALVIAFAFLWRDVDDATVDAARTYFASDAGAHATSALVEASLAGIDDVAAGIEADVRR